MEKGIVPKEKARQLVNQYYGYDGINNQREAIEAVERIVLATCCQKIDSLHAHVIVKDDYDIHLIKSAIIQLKNQQEIAYELHLMRMELSV